jgi:hypothetical protein
MDDQWKFVTMVKVTTILTISGYSIVRHHAKLCNVENKEPRGTAAVCSNYSQNDEG